MDLKELTKSSNCLANTGHAARTTINPEYCASVQRVYDIPIWTQNAGQAINYQI